MNTYVLRNNKRQDLCRVAVAEPSHLDVMVRGFNAAVRLLKPLRNGRHLCRCAVNTETDQFVTFTED